MGCNTLKSSPGVRQQVPSPTTSMGVLPAPSVHYVIYLQVQSESIYTDHFTTYVHLYSTHHSHIIHPHHQR